MSLTRTQAQRAGELALAGEGAQRWALIESLCWDDVCPGCGSRLADPSEDDRWEWDGAHWWHTCSPGVPPYQSVDGRTPSIHNED